MQLQEAVKIKEYKFEPVTIMQEKLNGYYTEVYVHEDGSVQIFQKNKKVDYWPKLQLINHIKETILSLPPGTFVKCELFSKAHKPTSVPTLINSASEDLLLAGLEIPLYGGEIPTFSFNEEKNTLRQHGFSIPAMTVLSNDPRPLTEAEVEYLKKLSKDAGIEGYVVRAEPRTGGWKIKHTSTVDCIVVGYEISDSVTMCGALKSLKLAVYGEDGKQVIIAQTANGLTKDYKELVDIETLMGRVIEVKYQEVGSKNRLIMPRIVVDPTTAGPRFRDDEKTPEQCLIDQIQ